MRSSRAKTAADYAAIAVAPVLIFLMISSLANFLMLILYHGGHPQRVAWIMLMFTMGSVGIARVAIENDRAYSLAYAGALGAVTFFAMLRFVNSPIFSALILILIAYLADRIVRDCTLIDDDVDSSGQGLIDSGRLFFRQQMATGSSSTAADAIDPDTAEHQSPKNRTRPAAHQPGRTVMYLALAALPLFGLGQFMLRNDPYTWDRAQLLLACYLFASLSLLVTTSFLGLRRYLRQRQAEMPGDVTVAWLAGGLALIAMVLTIAYVAPLPGQALASIELPELLDSPGETEASQHGWGDEGADRSNPQAATTQQDPQGDEKEIHSQTAAEGAPPGQVDQGQRDDGPTGPQSGGNQQGNADNASEQNSSDASSDPGQSPPPDSPPSAGQQNDAAAEQSNGEKKSGESNAAESSPSESSEKPAGESQSESDDSQSQTEPPSDSQSTDAQTEQPSPNQQQQQQQQRQPQPDSAAADGDGNQAARQPSIGQSLSGAVGMLGSLVKFVVILVLLGIVAAFVWMNRHLIQNWWQQLFAGRDQPMVESFDEFLAAETLVPPRSFGSFRNPIGNEPDPRRVIVITFQAFEAWTREQGVARGRNETPSEFMRRISQRVSNLSVPAGQVVDAYNRIVYGRGTATAHDLAAAGQVWQSMNSRQSVSPVA